MKALVKARLKLASDAALGSKPTPELVDTLSRVNPKSYEDYKLKKELIRVCVYVCVCMCAYVCVCVYIYIYIYTCMYVYIHMCLYIYVCVCMCVFA